MLQLLTSVSLLLLIVFAIQILGSLLHRLEPKFNAYDRRKRNFRVYYRTFRSAEAMWCNACGCEHVS